MDKMIGQLQTKLHSKMPVAVKVVHINQPSKTQEALLTRPMEGCQGQPNNRTLKHRTLKLKDRKQLRNLRFRKRH